MIPFIILTLTALIAVQEPSKSERVVMAGTARVERVDTFGRSITVRTDQGVIHTVYVGPELNVFDQLRSGDTVTIRVVESVIVALKRGAKPTALTDTTAAARKASGGQSDVQQQLRAIVTIESVDVQAQVVVYIAGDNRRVMRNAVDPHLLEGLKKGDVVELTYTRERAIELQKQP
jgi:hypothetical protein